MKKVLSVIIALTLIIGLVPSAFATADAGIKITYGMNAGPDYEFEYKTDVTQLTYADTSGFWAYHSSTPERTFITHPGYGISAGTAAWGEYLALKVYVPKAGTYNLSISHGQYKFGGQPFVCVFKNDITDVPSAVDGTSQIFKGRIDCYKNVTSPEKVTTDLGEITFPEAGEYIFAYRTTAAYNMYPGDITLDGGGSGVVPVSAKISIENDVAVASGPVYMSDGSKETLDDSFTVTYKSSDSSVATVNATTGAITKKGNGTAKITAEISKNGGVGVASTDYTVNSVITYGMNAGPDYEFEYKTDVTQLTYADTSGFWAYHSSTPGRTFTTHPVYGINAATGEAGEYFAIKIYVPKAGMYDLTFSHGQYKTGGKPLAYIFKGDVADVPSAIGTAAQIFKARISCNQNVASPVKVTTNFGPINFPVAGDYVVAYWVETKHNIFPGDVILAGSDDGVLPISAKISIENDVAVASGPVYMSDGTKETLDDSFTVTYKSSDSSVAAVNATTGAITKKGNGTAKITAEISKNGGVAVPFASYEVSGMSQGEEVSDTVSVYVGAEAGGTVSATGCTANAVDEVDFGTEITATATANTGYGFAYWKNASGTALSTDESYTFKANGNTAVIAVFDAVENPSAETTTLEFWNGNGGLIEKKTVTKGATFASAKISAPSITGYVFDKWSVEDTDTIDMLTRAVAQFKEADTSYTVYVNGSPVMTGKKYGEEVTVTSEKANFASWKLGGNTVSYDKSYTFYVWGDVYLTDEAGTAEDAIPTVGIANFGGTNFIYYNVPTGYTKVEAGLLFSKSGTPTISSFFAKAVAKESKANGQFTAIPNNDETIARGYLIFKNNTSGETRVIYADILIG